MTNSTTQLQDQFIETNNIRLHYLDYAGGEPSLLMMHGVTANAQSFNHLATELNPRFRLLVPDLRGRGLSDAPATGYTQADHAADMIGLLDHLGIAQATLVGHSFGGMLALYMGAYSPDRVSKIVLMDAGLLHPQVADLIKSSTDRIGRRWPSWAAYLGWVKQAAYLQGHWEPALEAYFRADVKTLDDGSVTTRSTPEAIAQSASGIVSTPWLEVLGKVKQPVLLINAPSSYGAPGAPAVQPAEQAQQTATLLADCRVVQVPGNHVTMAFSAGAAAVAKAIREFVS